MFTVQCVKSLLYVRPSVRPSHKRSQFKLNSNSCHQVYTIYERRYAICCLSKPKT